MRFAASRLSRRASCTSARDTSSSPSLYLAAASPSSPSATAIRSPASRAQCDRLLDWSDGSAGVATEELPVPHRQGDVGNDISSTGDGRRSQRLALQHFGSIDVARHQGNERRIEEGVGDERRIADGTGNLQRLLVGLSHDPVVALPVRDASKGRQRTDAQIVATLYCGHPEEMFDGRPALGEVTPALPESPQGASDTHPNGNS
jgi:hypothetical protein